MGLIATNEHARREARDTLTNSWSKEVEKIIKDYNIKSFSLKDLSANINIMVNYKVTEKSPSGIMDNYISPQLAGQISGAIQVEQELVTLNIKTEILKAEQEITNFIPNTNYDILNEFYQHLANGEDYKKGSAGNSQFDPTKPYNPATQEPPSELSNILFGRNQFKAGGSRFNETLQNIHSSNLFKLNQKNYSLEQKEYLLSSLNIFYKKIYTNATNAVQEISPYVLVTYTEKKDKSKFKRWLKRALYGRKVEITEQDKANKRKFLQELIKKECNVYLKNIENQMDYLQTTNTLQRYNYGLPKGEVHKKRTYQVLLDETDFNKLTQEQIAVFSQDTKQILEYMKNPQLIKDEQEKLTKKLSLINNYYEACVCLMLSVFDEIIETKESKDIDKEIQNRIINKLKTYGETFGVSYMLFGGDEISLAFYYFYIATFGEESAKQFDMLKDPKTPQETIQSFKSSSPSYNIFTNLINSTSARADLETLQEINTAYYIFKERSQLDLVYNFVTNEENIKDYKELYGENLEYKP